MHTSQIRDRLEQRRSELRARTVHIGSDLRGEAAPAAGSFADQASAHANDPVLEGIRESAEAELAQIDKALRRITDGRYERCESCGGPIEKDRLQALPYATTCVSCAG
jgi:DnaK suppressor protein